jgi:hypothetical protein
MYLDVGRQPKQQGTHAACGIDVDDRPYAILAVSLPLGRVCKALVVITCQAHTQ